MAYFKVTKIIEKKRNGEKLTDNDIGYFIDCVVKSSKSNNEEECNIDKSQIDCVVKSSKSNNEEECNIDKSQIGAMLMAMYLKGLDLDETSKLTKIMTESGFVFNWPEEWSHLVVDKHSTGGVGDKVSLILAPALAAVGLKVPMISGRSLRHTGGTLDKLESIPGFRVCLTKEEIYETVKSVGCCIVGQTEDCAPADRILYQCREMTGTVTSAPLIVASIVSKKLCEGIKALVYDVKYGKGSIFSSKEEAEECAKNLVQFSKGTAVSALTTSMEKPLGRAIGNSVEVIEAIDCLKGKGPSDVVEITCALGAELLQLVQGTSTEKGRSMILSVINNGKALQKFQSMMNHQGVAAEIAKELCYGNGESVLPKSRYCTDVVYDGEDGYVEEIDPMSLAMIWKDELAESNKHLGVGLTLLKIVGSSIKKGEAWVRVHHQRNKLTDEIQTQLKNAIYVKKLKSNNVLIDKRFYMSDMCIPKEEKYS